MNPTPASLHQLHLPGIVPARPVVHPLTKECLDLLDASMQVDVRGKVAEEDGTRAALERVRGFVALVVTAKDNVEITDFWPENLQQLQESVSKAMPYTEATGSLAELFRAFGVEITDPVTTTPEPQSLRRELGFIRKAMFEWERSWSNSFPAHDVTKGQRTEAERKEV